MFFCNLLLGASNTSPVRKGARINFDDLISQSSSELTGRLPTPWLMETYQLDLPLDCATVLRDDEVPP